MQNLRRRCDWMNWNWKVCVARSRKSNRRSFWDVLVHKSYDVLLEINIVSDVHGFVLRRSQLAHHLKEFEVLLHAVHRAEPSSPVDYQGVTGHIGRCIAHQEQSCLCDLLLRAHPHQGNVVLEQVVQDISALSSNCDVNASLWIYCQTTWLPLHRPSFEKPTVSLIGPGAIPTTLMLNWPSSAARCFVMASINIFV